MLDIKRFKEIVDSFHNDLLKVQDEITNVKLADDKWSLGEIIGHLIDSASNNHQRFVRLQYDDLLSLPAYDGEKWVKTQRYINMKWSVLVPLWYNYNCLLLNIIENADVKAFDNVWVKGEDALPLKHLMNDYYKHLELHIEHFKTRLQELQCR